jgi:hypothetical protein
MNRGRIKDVVHYYHLLFDTRKDGRFVEQGWSVERSAKMARKEKGKNCGQVCIFDKSIF